VSRDSPLEASPLAEPRSGTDQNPERIRAMFARITPRYDLLNRLLSAAQDGRWRRRLVEETTAGLEPCRRLLDAATGTGDVAGAAFRRRPTARVVGVDFSRPMLLRARTKFARRPAMAWIEADALRLPFRDGAFDAALVAFGLRNMVDRAAALSELGRVIRPGGRLGILEFFEPPSPLVRRVYGLYSSWVMPRVGRWVSGSEAYGYLPHSIRCFWSPEELGRAMRQSGLVRLRRWSLSAGIVGLHVGEIPGAPQAPEPDGTGHV